MLHETAIGPLSSTGCSNYFQKTSSTEVPFATLSGNSPVEWTQQTRRALKTSSGARIFNLLCVLYQSDKKQLIEDKLQR